jgi:uncharacterized membrane protein
MAETNKKIKKRRRRKRARKGLIIDLRNRLVTGLVIALPIVATIAVMAWIINGIDGMVFQLIPEAAEPRVFGYRIPGVGVVIAVILLILLGGFARNIFGRSMIRTFEKAMLRLPIFSNIYNFIRQVVGVFSQNKESSFNEVCLIEYPRPGLWAVGFVTTDLKGAPATHLKGGYVCVFVPTTPNPTSGFLLFAKREDLTILDMSPEEGAKLIISGGMVTSNEDLSDLTEEIPGPLDPSLPSSGQRRPPARKGKVKAVPRDPGDL